MAIRYGTDANDNLYGTASDDEIYGYGGNDIIYFDSGDNIATFFEGHGADTVYSGKGTDTLYFDVFQTAAELNNSLKATKSGNNLILKYTDKDSVTLVNFSQTVHL